MAGHFPSRMVFFGIKNETIKDILIIEPTRCTNFSNLFLE